MSGGGTGGPAVPAKCLKCGWLGLRSLDEVDPRVTALWETSGIEAPILNRCRACKTGECVDIEGVVEFEGALSAHIARKLAPLMPDVAVRVTAEMREREGRVSLTASVDERVATFEVTAAQVDSPRFRQILERVTASMARELTRPQESVEPTPLRNVSDWTAGRDLRRFTFASSSSGPTPATDDNNQPAPPPVAPDPEEA